jgi:hypothetical protein
MDPPFLYVKTPGLYLKIYDNSETSSPVHAVCKVNEQTNMKLNSLK